VLRQLDDALVPVGLALDLLRDEEVHRTRLHRQHAVHDRVAREPVPEAEPARRGRVLDQEVLVDRRAEKALKRGAVAPADAR
jgi:hypothetical protein